MSCTLTAAPGALQCVRTCMHERNMTQAKLAVDMAFCQQLTNTLRIAALALLCSPSLKCTTQVELFAFEQWFARRRTHMSQLCRASPWVVAYSWDGRKHCLYSYERTGTYGCSRNTFCLSFGIACTCQHISCTLLQVPTSMSSTKYSMRSRSSLNACTPSGVFLRVATNS
jgi:hypothetical protein